MDGSIAGTNGEFPAGMNGPAPAEPETGGDQQQGQEGQAPAEPQDPAQHVLEQFGGDPAALARAFAELNHKVGSMANELGQLRAKAELADRLIEKQLGGEAEEEKDPVTAIAEKIREQVEEGGDPFEALLSGVRELISKEVEPVKQQAQQVNAELVYERFVAAHPDAEKYFQTMQQIHQEMPWLLPTDQGEAAFMKGLEALYTIARQRAGVAGNRQQASSGQLDSRRRAVASRPSGGNRGQGNEVLNDAFNKAIRSGRLDDWKNLVEKVLFQE